MPRWDVFLSHDWGEGQSNHRRVFEVGRWLQKRGLSCWIDEEQMQYGNVADSMCHGIDNSEIILCFITHRYIQKTAYGREEDNCRGEFQVPAAARAHGPARRAQARTGRIIVALCARQYAAMTRGAKRMLAVVMEDSMLDISRWKGQVGMLLARKMYAPLIAGDEAELGRRARAIP